VSRRLAVLVNPAAAGGKSLRTLPKVEDELRRLGAEYRVVRSDSGDHAKHLARQMADAGEVAVAIGGDGLVGTLAGALSGTDGKLAIIPSGRGNDFARVLGIPKKDPAAAARLAVEGESRALDVGSVDGKTFVGIASFGFDSECNDVANEVKIIRSNLVYAYSAIRVLARWKDARFTVTIDGRRREFSGYSVAAANSKAFGGGMLMAPDAELDDGKLDVVTISTSSKWRYISGMPSLFKGTHVNRETVQIERGEVIEVDADRQFTIFADGDPLARTPATITVARRALNVIVP
jgi:YegS/Rv2252/BmrU family lipid kinase